jgi:hypothetical protein
MVLVTRPTGHVGATWGGGRDALAFHQTKWGRQIAAGPMNASLERDQIRSGNRTMNLPALGIFTFGRLWASITSFSPMTLLSDRI